MTSERDTAGWRTYLNAGAMPFWAVHLAAVAGVCILGWSWRGLALALALYAVRMFFVTAGYHRYFSHRSFKTSRWFQLVLAVGAQTSLQRGVLWWASKHRSHHRYADTPQDVHTPARGFWWSHLGWSTSPIPDTVHDNVRDLSRFPELRFLDRRKHTPGVLYAAATLALGGWHGLVWGFLVSTVLLWHGTFLINSMAHLIGRRRYNTADDSRNHWALALITLGEGWHNNHHHYMSSARQGFRWWEIDITYYVLRALQCIGIVRDVRVPPPHVVEDRPRVDAAARPPAAEQLAA